MLPKQISKTNFYQYSRCQSYAYFKDYLKIPEDETSGITQEKLKEFEKVEELAMINSEILFETKTIYGKGDKQFDIKLDSNLYFRADGFQFLEDGRYRVLEVKAKGSKSVFKNFQYPVKENGKKVIKTLIHPLSGKNHFIIKRSQSENIKEQEKIDSCFRKATDRNNKDIGKYIWDVSFQHFVMEQYKKEQNNYDTNIKYKEGEYYLVTLNTDYVYDGKLDKDGQPKYDITDLFIYFNVTQIVKENYKNIQKEYIKVVESFSLREDPKDYYQVSCFTPSKNDANYFPYFSHVYGDYFKSLNSIMHISGSSLRAKKKIEYLLENNFNSEITDDFISKQEEKLAMLAKVQKEGITYFNKNKMQKFINSLTYPLYHLDFETYPSPLPRYSGESPYQQSVFQYSLHVEREKGVCDEDKNHFEYLISTAEDKRYDLFKTLVSHFNFKEKFTVIAWNQSFEKDKIKVAASLFPDLADKLMIIHDSTVDLMHMVAGNKKIFGDSMPVYHNQKQKGSTSIKAVLPIFAPKISYEGLSQVKNGTDAMEAYLDLINQKSENSEQTISNMLKYCKLDTYAMVEILREGRKLLKGENE
jgi:hypothetical protein